MFFFAFLFLLIVAKSKNGGFVDIKPMLAILLFADRASIRGGNRWK